MYTNTHLIEGLNFQITVFHRFTPVAEVSVAGWKIRVVDFSDDTEIIKKSVRAILSIIYENPEEKPSDIAFRKKVEAISYRTFIVS